MLEGYMSKIQEAVGRKRTNIAMFTKDELIDLYVNQNMSQRKIAKHKGCGKTTVWWYFKKYNIKVLTTKDKVNLRQIRRCRYNL